MTALAPTVEMFFTQRLATERDASPHTVAAYRDTLRLLLVFTQEHTGKAPSRLDVGDLDAGLIAAFLTHLETDRGNSTNAARVKRPAACA
jgi:site-specific recombinase XerC